MTPDPKPNSTAKQRVAAPAVTAASVLTAARRQGGKFTVATLWAKLGGGNRGWFDIREHLRTGDAYEQVSKSFYRLKVEEPPPPAEVIPIDTRRPRKAKTGSSSNATEGGE